jgi:predicted phage terminase large subunit-like protein
METAYRTVYMIAREKLTPCRFFLSVVKSSVYGAWYNINMDLVNVPLQHLEAELYARDFARFVETAWPQVDPARLMWHYHLDAICEHLTAVRDGQIRDLLINIPPGLGKSMLCSVLYPAWVWARDPEHRFLCGSYAFDLSLRDAVRCRDVIKSKWYQDHWPLEIKQDQNSKSYFENTAKGYRLALSVGARATGFRGDTIIVDDPLSASDSQSDAALYQHVDWFDRVLSTRVNDERTARRIVIMQRLHGADLAGVLLDRGWTALVLPMEFEPERKCMVEVTGWQDWRKEPGELLFPERFPREAVERKKVELASDYAGQYQQGPTAAEGGEIKAHWLRFWYPPDEPAPNPVRVRIGQEYYNCHQAPLPDDLRHGQSWDLNVKETKRGSFAVGLIWGHTIADDYILDMFRERCEFTRTVQALLELSKAWPQAGVKLIEDKANGPAVISQLKSQTSGLVPVQVTQGDKQARVKAVAPFFRAGNVYLPHPDLYPWAREIVNELTQFPNAPNDDIADATSQWLDCRHNNGVTRLQQLVSA